MARKLSKPLDKPDASKPPFFRYGYGWWEYNYQRQIKNQKYHFRKRWFSTMEEAKENLDSEIEKLENKIEIENRRKGQKTYEDLRIAYLNNRIIQDGIASSSIYSKDMYSLKRFFDPYYSGKAPIEIFNEKEAQAFYKRLLTAKTRFGEPMSNKNANRVVNTYRNMLDYCMGLRLIDETDYSICSFIVKPIKRKEEDIRLHAKKTYAMADEDIQKLLEYLPSITLDGALFRFLLWTGFRLGEALGLTPHEIDFDRKVIYKEYIWGIDKDGKYSRIHRTKNASEGEYIVSDKVIDLLQEFVNGYSIGQRELIFSMQQDRGRAIDGSAFRRRIQGYCKKIGIPYCWPHIARHTFCTNLSKVASSSPQDRKIIESVTGHRFDTDQSDYVHADEARTRELVNKI